MHFYAFTLLFIRIRFFPIETSLLLLLCTFLFKTHISLRIKSFYCALFFYMTFNAICLQNIYGTAWLMFIRMHRHLEKNELSSMQLWWFMENILQKIGIYEGKMWILDAKMRKITCIRASEPFFHPFLKKLRFSLKNLNFSTSIFEAANALLKIFRAKF